MKSKLVMLSVLSLFVISSSFAAVYAVSLNQPKTWNWTMCNASTVKGTMEASGSIGSSLVTITWTVPSSSYEVFDGCQKMPLTVVNVATYVNRAGIIPITGYCVSGASSGFCQFTAEYQENIGGHVIIRPLDLKIGDKVVVDVAPTYGPNYATHGNTVSFTV